MKLDRQKHWQFLEDELRAETENFDKKFETSARYLLEDTEEMFVGQFISFRDGEMIMKFPNTRNLPRKGEYLFCMVLPKELRNYHNWAEKTYRDLYNERHKSTDTVCIWQSSTDDTRFSLVGFRKVSVEFSEFIGQTQGIILVFAPQRPPLDYVINLQRIVKDNSSPRIAEILDADYQMTDWKPQLIRHGDVASFARTQLSLSDKMIVQGPPGTGKTYMIAELCATLCNEGYSVLVTAYTNRALMEISEKPALEKMLSTGKVMKTGMTTDEQNENKSLRPVNSILPCQSSIILSTYFITSGLATELTSEIPFDFVIMDEASQALTAMFAVANKLGKKNLWIGDIQQLPPIVALNEDRIRIYQYENMINGLKLLAGAGNQPIYQLTETYRFGQRTANYTGIFYNDTLKSMLPNANKRIPYPFQIFNSNGGPSLLLTDLNPNDYTPTFAIQLTTYIVGRIIKEDKTKDIAVITCMIRTTKGLQKSIIQHVGNHSKILIETVARIQGLTTDITIYVIPYVSYLRSLEPHLFNVATSRAREHTIIIGDKSIMKYPSMDLRVKEYMEKLYHEQCIYIPTQRIKGYFESVDWRSINATKDKQNFE